MVDPVGEGAAQNAAVRSFLSGEAAALDAADQAGLSVASFLDLVERVRTADGSAGPDAPGEERPDISVVIPVFNEEGNIPPLLEQLIPVVASIGTYEVVFVNDCSSDRSREVILAARATNPSVKLVELARNFGHQGALSAGYDFARGDAVIVMDADLQDPPTLLPEMVAKWREGFEVVYAVREKRKENILLRASFFVFYRLLQRIADIKLPLDSGDFCLMDRKVLDAIRALPEANRFLRGLRGWVGFRQVGVHYERGTLIHRRHEILNPEPGPLRRRRTHLVQRRAPSAGVVRRPRHHCRRRALSARRGGCVADRR